MQSSSGSHNSGGHRPFKTAAKLLRVKQWTKNLLLFTGLIFSYSFLQLEPVINAFLAFTFFAFFPVPHI